MADSSEAEAIKGLEPLPSEEEKTGGAGEGKREASSPVREVSGAIGEEGRRAAVSSTTPAAAEGSSPKQGGSGKRKREEVEEAEEDDDEEEEEEGESDSSSGESLDLSDSDEGSDAESAESDFIPVPRIPKVMKRETGTKKKKASVPRKVVVSGKKKQKKKSRAPPGAAKKKKPSGRVSRGAGKSPARALSASAKKKIVVALRKKIRGIGKKIQTVLESQLAK